MIPNWPELWEREPGLRPLTGRWLHTFEGDSKAQQAWDWYRGKENNLPVTDEYFPGWFLDGVRLDEDVFAALCRDAAVRWLAVRGQYLDRCQWDDQRRWRVVELSCDELVSVGGLHESPDTALVEAITAALDARDANATAPAPT